MTSGKDATATSKATSVGRRPASDLDTVLVHALDSRWQVYRKALKRCRKKYSEGGVHDLRVAVRRLISTFAILARLMPDNNLRKARRALKKHLDMIGPLRDVQIQLLYIDQMLAELPVLQECYGQLMKRERKLVRRIGARLNDVKPGQARKAVRATSKKLHTLMRSSGGQEEPFTAAISIVDAAFSEVVGYRQTLDPADATTIHRMRVAFKKFRYVVEVLQPLLPRVTAKQLQEMNAFQTMMGDIQDIEVLTASVNRFFRKRPLADTSLRPVQQALMRRRRALIALFLDAADQLFTFWQQEQPRPVSRPLSKKREV